MAAVLSSFMQAYVDANILFKAAELKPDQRFTMAPKQFPRASSSKDMPCFAGA